jgi:hypothetical protein
MNPLQAALKKHKVKFSPKATVEALNDAAMEKSEQLRRSNRQGTEGVAELRCLQVDFACSVQEIDEARPGFVFTGPYGQIATSQGPGAQHIAIPQQACLQGQGAWLKQSSTQADLQTLAEVARVLGPLPGEDCDAFYPASRGDGDAQLACILAPLAPQHRKVTPAAFAALREAEQLQLACDSLGIGENLQEYLARRGGMEVEVYNLADLANGDEALIDELYANLEEALAPLGQLCHISVEDVAVMQPCFAVGVTPNGNVAGYWATIVRT